MLHAGVILGHLNPHTAHLNLCVLYFTYTHAMLHAGVLEIDSQKVVTLLHVLYIDMQILQLILFSHTHVLYIDMQILQLILFSHTYI